MKNDQTDPDHYLIPTVAEPDARARLLEQYKRASLHRHALRTTWDLGALLRRVDRELPEMLPQLVGAFDVLLLLSRRLSPRRRSGPTSPASAGTDATQEPAEAASPRQGELF